MFIVICGVIAVVVVLLLAGGVAYFRMAVAATRLEQQRHLEERQRALERLANVAEQAEALRLAPEEAATAAEQFGRTGQPDAFRPDEAGAAIAAARSRKVHPPQQNH